MAVVKAYNLAKMTTATTGTGTITLGYAVSGFLTFANAGVQNGETVSYAIRDGANSEVGRGVYTSSGTASLSTGSSDGNVTGSTRNVAAGHVATSAGNYTITATFSGSGTTKAFTLFLLPSYG